MHGEDVNGKRYNVNDEETPPRAWGRQFAMVAKLHIVGNTPTCMGKTGYSDKLKLCGQKHPHVHGEDPLDGS